ARRARDRAAPVGAPRADRRRDRGLAAEEAGNQTEIPGPRRNPAAEVAGQSLTRRPNTEHRTRNPGRFLTLPRPLPQREGRRTPPPRFAILGVLFDLFPST